MLGGFAHPKVRMHLGAQWLRIAVILLGLIPFGRYAYKSFYELIYNYWMSLLLFKLISSGPAGPGWAIFIHAEE